MRVNPTDPIPKAILQALIAEDYEINELADACLPRPRRAVSRNDQLGEPRYDLVLVAGEKLRFVGIVRLEGIVRLRLRSGGIRRTAAVAARLRIGEGPLHKARKLRRPCRERQRSQHLTTFQILPCHERPPSFRRWISAIPPPITVHASCYFTVMRLLRSVFRKRFLKSCKNVPRDLESVNREIPGASVMRLIGPIHMDRERWDTR